MINILYETVTVEGTLGSKKQKVGTNCTEEESEDTTSIHIKIWIISTSMEFSFRISNSGNRP